MYGFTCPSDKTDSSSAPVEQRPPTTSADEDNEIKELPTASADVDDAVSEQPKASADIDNVDNEQATASPDVDDVANEQQTASADGECRETESTVIIDDKRIDTLE
jgi:hypothetical protein